MTLALSIVCLALIGLLAYREWGSATDRREAAAESARVDAERQDERREHREERAELYQRIQAPEVAVADAHRERRGPYVRREPIGADNDAAFMARSAARKAERKEEAVDG